MGRGAPETDNQQSTFAHTLWLKPLTHFTVVPDPLCPLRFKSRRPTTANCAGRHASRHSSSLLHNEPKPCRYVTSRLELR